MQKGKETKKVMQPAKQPKQHRENVDFISYKLEIL